MHLAKDDLDDPLDKHASLGIRNEIDSYLIGVSGLKIYNWERGSLLIHKSDGY